jgi:isocitrate dehydrogenase
MSQTQQKPSFQRTKVTYAIGDGIGPEIMAATLSILKAAGAQVDFEEIVVGEAAYLQGHSSGIAPEAWESLRRNRVFLKAPVSTPQGKGFKSLNVTIRKTLGLYANVRPCVSFAPFVKTHHPKMDLVVIRENEEDLYAGIEHRQTQDVVQCLKLYSRSGCERIARYAFEYARTHGRKKVTCLSKDNIMKLTDGLFRSVFEEVGKEYPEIAQDHMIIDIGTARVANAPEKFDVILTSNLYGDIISDVAAEVAGSVGLAESSNVGDGFAMFEAIHGSAPDIAGKNIANPSGLLLSAVQMLAHIGQAEVGARIRDAWSVTIEKGIHTGDLKSEITKSLVGTKEFAQAVIDNLGQKPSTLKAQTSAATQATVSSNSQKQGSSAQKSGIKVEKKELVGIDMFLDMQNIAPEELANRIQAAEKPTALRLQMVTNRGARVWPDGMPETRCVDHWRCRFKGTGELNYGQVLETMKALTDAGLEVVKTENLYTFDGVRGFSLGQGEG